MRLIAPLGHSDGALLLSEQTATAALLNCVCACVRAQAHTHLYVLFQAVIAALMECRQDCATEANGRRDNGCQEPVGNVLRVLGMPGRNGWGGGLRLSRGALQTAALERRVQISFRLEVEGCKLTLSVSPGVPAEASLAGEAFWFLSVITKFNVWLRLFVSRLNYSLGFFF